MRLLNVLSWTFEAWCDRGHMMSARVTSHRLLEELKALHDRIKDGLCEECGEPFLLWRVSLPGTDWETAEEMLLREAQRQQKEDS